MHPSLLWPAVQPRPALRTSTSPRHLPIATLALTCAMLLTACGKEQQGPGQMPPPPVGVVTVAPTSVPIEMELSGRLEPIRTAQVRARVTGVVQKRLFTEGAVVQAGQSLYRIDPAPYQAALESAQAAQAKADAALAQAQSTLERNRPLAESKMISALAWDGTQATHRAAQADLAAAKAAVQQARLNVEYASVLAPINGRIGRSLVTEGALVSQAEATQLTTIQQVDTLMANFTQSASEAMRIQRAIASGNLKGSTSAQVKVLLDDGSVYPLPGRLMFADIAVDPGTGQVTLRAEVPNPKGELLPGLFIKVRLQVARSEQAMVLPQQAVTRGTSEDTVLVVGADSQVSKRPVQLGGMLGDASNPAGPQWIITGGLKSGEQVVVDGFQKIRPKAPVKPVPWQAASAAAPSASAPASAPAAKN
ncbi:MAG: efflux RND transporter periplasmic adaptor subunit [Limnohabitans sp.]